MLASNVNLASGTVTYWPNANPADTHVITNTASGSGGATIATFDTTTLSNGAYILDLAGSDDRGNPQESRVLLTVAGDYKPGRLFELVPAVAGPVVLGFMGLPRYSERVRSPFSVL